MEILPIAHIKTEYKEKFGIPRQSGRVDSVGIVIFEPKYRIKEALNEIEGFSHLWLLFDFSLSHRGDWSPTVRPPRLGGNRRVGVFASRSPFRPNNIGLSCVKLIEVRKTDEYGFVLIVSGADLLDGTPIYDVKPYLPSSDCIADAKGGYADVMNNHKLKVEFSEETAAEIPADVLDKAIECIADDPRPSYQNDSDRIYGMKYGKWNFKFTVDGDTAAIISAETAET